MEEINEKFIHYLWKNKLLDSKLHTTDNQELTILKTGINNPDEGPDFFNAQIKIGEVVWAGNVEIHIKSSDWQLHKHQNDEIYNNIILHVVLKDDKPVFRKTGEKIPTLIIQNHFPQEILQNYRNLIDSPVAIPCQNQIREIDSFTLNNWFERIIIERLEKKVHFVENTLLLNKNSWEESFYQLLARSFGSKINAEPFELLAKSLPLKYLSKHKNNLFQLEAMILGQAGMLHTTFHDDYPKLLQKEYFYLKSKFSLEPIQTNLWKFLRLRPNSFPTIRLSQFAGLIHKSSHLLSKILETSKAEELFKLFETEASEYWIDHYTFDKLSTPSKKNFGKTSIQILLINTVVPILFIYGIKHDSQKYKDLALDLLQQLEPENNSIIKTWHTANIKPQNALHSQALLELKANYCDKKLCLQCAVGNKLLYKA